MRLLIKFEYDVLSAVRRLQAPILIDHSPQDEIVPFSHGEGLFSAASEPKQLLQMRDGHNDGFLLIMPPVSQTRISPSTARRQRMLSPGDGATVDIDKAAIVGSCGAIDMAEHLCH